MFCLYFFILLLLMMYCYCHHLIISIYPIFVNVMVWIYFVTILLFVLEYTPLLIFVFLDIECDCLWSNHQMDICAIITIAVDCIVHFCEFRVGLSVYWSLLFSIVNVIINPAYNRNGIVFVWDQTSQKAPLILINIQTFIIWLNLNKSYSLPTNCTETPKAVFWFIIEWYKYMFKTWGIQTHMSFVTKKYIKKTLPILWFPTKLYHIIDSISYSGSFWLLII